MDRMFGITADPVLAGTGYDDLPTGKAIPAPKQAWPVTSISASDGITARERTDEMRGGRATSAPTTGQQAPTVTVAGRAYPELVTTLLYMALGATSRTGSAPAAFTDKILPADDAAQFLPGAHISWAGDGLYEQGAGAKLQRLALTFPQGEDGTFEAEFRPLWHTFLDAPDPDWVADFEYLADIGDQEWILQLRDAQAFEGSSATPLECLRSFSMEIGDIYRDPDFCGHKNREDIGTGSTFTRIHWPDTYRRAPRRLVTGSIELRGRDRAREEKARALQSEQLVVEVDGRPLGTTPPATELLRTTLLSQVMQRDGARTINRDDDLNTTMNWSAYANAQGKDVEIEYVSTRATGITIPA